MFEVIRTWYNALRTRRTEGRLASPRENVVGGIGALENQLRLSAAYAAYRRLCNDCAGLTLDVRSEDGIRLPRSQVLQRLPALYPFVRRANPSMGAYQYLMRVHLDLATFSAHLARRFDTLGRLSLEPLDLTRWRPERKNGVVDFYDSQAPSNRLTSAQVFYVTAFGDGLVGYSASENMATTAGTADAANVAAGDIYANKMQPAGVLSIDMPLNDTQADRVKQNYSDIVTGKGSSRLWLLEAAMKYQPVNFTAADAQLLQTRRFQIEEICRFIGVPPFLIFENSVTTTLGSSLEEMLGAYYDGPIKHHATALSRAIELQLMTDTDAASYAIGFDLDTARLASYKSRIEAHSVAVQSGQLTPDEARAREGHGPLPGGGQLFVQGALRPATTPYSQGGSPLSTGS